MTCAEKIIKKLKLLSKTQKIVKRGNYTTATATFDTDIYEEVKDRINDAIEPIVKNGEKIISNIDAGEIIDSRIKGFEIEKGVLIELYDYKKTTTIFIRLYQINDKKKSWLALYIDENPDTPWWTDEEREN